MKNTKKGFSLVELVIVIAVIAVLAAVLIPTFTFVLDNAKQAKALNDYKTMIDKAYIDYISSGNVPAKLYKQDNSFTFEEPTSGSYTEYTFSNDKCYIELEKDVAYLLWNSSSYKVSATVESGYAEITGTAPSGS